MRLNWIACLVTLALWAAVGSAHAGEPLGRANTAPTLAAWSDLLPDLSTAAVTWFGVVVVLVLTITTAPVRSMRNLDGLVLAATCLLLGLRFDEGAVFGEAAGRSVQWWSYLLLSVSAGYWLLRGVQLLLSRSAPGVGCNVSQGAMVILVLASLAICVMRINQAGQSSGSQDGVVGGAYTAVHGKLPYGNASGYDARSPLLYLVHAGTWKIAGTPAESDSAQAAGLFPDTGHHDSGMELAVGASVNLVLLSFTLIGLFVVGWRLHSSAMGLTAVALFSAFPGTQECLSQPDIMLPAMLLTWTIAFALLPGVRGVLSLGTLVFAGLAWPWAWLLTPVLLAHFYRQGFFQASGATVGLLGGVAACLAGLTCLTQPTLPRFDGALAAAASPDLQPQYTAQLTEDGSIMIDKHTAGAAIEKDLKSWAWSWLVQREQSTLASAPLENGPRVALPNAVDGADVMYRAVDARGDAAAALQPGYRAAIAEMELMTRMWVALRTVAESTWLSADPPAAPIKGTWELWAGSESNGEPNGASSWSLIRRIAKFGAGLVSLMVAALLFFGARREKHQLIGGLLAVASAALLVSELGAVSNLAWLLPVALAAIASHSGPSRRSEQTNANRDLREVNFGPEPRITVER